MKTNIFFRYIFIFTFFWAGLDVSRLFSQQKRGKSLSSESHKSYIIHKLLSDSIVIDGKPDERPWELTDWTDPFLDIQGDHLPLPRFETRAKILWDDDFLYIAAQMEEPHVQATIRERDAVIFMDNNFEVFIDPDGDTHNYYELEVNALGTFWDLMLTKPYRNGGRPVNAWDIKGLKIGVDIRGTLNDPSDTDEGWTLEIAIPFDVLNETLRGEPADGTQWRLNFSRVEWQVDIENGNYVKKTDPDTGKTLPEDNWVWSPQGIVDMHLPERWGIVQFSEEAPGSNVSFSSSANFNYEWVLRELYYRQQIFRSEQGRYAETTDQLNGSDFFDESDIQPDIQIRVLDNTYIMSLTAEDLDYTFYIREDSRAWKEVKK